MTSRGGFTMSSNAADDAEGHEADQPLASPRRRNRQAWNRRSSVTRGAALALASVLAGGVLAARRFRFRHDHSSSVIQFIEQFDKVIREFVVGKFYKIGGFQ